MIVIMKTRKELIHAVNKAISDVDPIALIALGAPKDEYIPEAEMIVDLLMKDDTILCSPEIVFDVFLKMFEEEITKKECKTISDKINNILNLNML